jgi:hypothetical protein
MTYSHERYQAFCRYCYRTHENDTAIEAIRATEEHEKGCPRKPQPKEGK